MESAICLPNRRHLLLWGDLWAILGPGRWWGVGMGWEKTPFLVLDPSGIIWQNWELLFVEMLNAERHTHHSG